MVTPEQLEQLEDDYLEEREEFCKYSQEDLQLQLQDINFNLNCKRYFMYAASSLSLFILSADLMFGFIFLPILALFLMNLTQYFNFHQEVYQPFQEDMYLRVNHLFTKWRHLFKSAGAGLYDEVYDLDLNITTSEGNQTLMNHKINEYTRLLVESVVFVKICLISGNFFLVTPDILFYIVSVGLMGLVFVLAYEYANILRRRKVVIGQYKEFLKLNKTKEGEGLKIKYFMADDTETLL